MCTLCCCFPFKPGAEVCCFVLAFSPIKVKGDGIDVLEEALCRITLDKSYARRSSLAQRESWD